VLLVQSDTQGSKQGPSWEELLTERAPGVKKLRDLQYLAELLLPWNLSEYARTRSVEQESRARIVAVSDPCKIKHQE
jgi:hypothetical protein